MATLGQPSEPEAALPPEARRELERILSSRTFEAAPRLSRFLRYVTERALDGDIGNLKEYAIGLDVFDRDASFDPRVDTIVRVQARRLRRRLEKYYSDEGSDARLRIEMPKGAYIPVLAAAAPAERPHSVKGLPAPRTALVGRRRELRSLTDLLRREGVRLVTVTGPGGVGKTRLAIAAAVCVAEEFPGGIHYIELAPLRRPADVVGAVAQACGLFRTDGKPLEEALCDRLRTAVTAPSLLVVDNFEHVLDAADLVSKLLDACGFLTVLATSRALLHLYGEHEFPTPPLEAPDPASSPALETLSQSPAVRLFVERARAVRPDFQLDAGNACDVAAICFRVDGLPLAIELAAARVKAHPPGALLKELSRSLQSLRIGHRDVPDRQRTLLATIRWSYELLNEDEKKLFRRLASFVGGCTHEGLEAVGDAYEDLTADVAELADSLVDKNLLYRTARLGGPQRFAMLQTIREFGLNALLASDEAADVLRAHAAYCIVIAEESETKHSELERQEWFALCDREYGNLNAALDWLLEAGAANWYARLAIALFQYWERRERLEEGGRRLEIVLELSGLPDDAKARAAGFAGALSGMRSDIEQAIEYHRRALEIFRRINSLRDIAREANSLAVGYRFTNRAKEARRMLEECLSACREIGDRNQVAATLSNLANLAAEQREFAEAESRLEEARRIFREIGNWIAEAWSLSHLGDYARAQNDCGTAQRRYCEALRLFRDLENPWGEGRTLQDMGELAIQCGNAAEAETLLRDSLSVFADLPHHRGVANVLDSLAVLHCSRSEPHTAFELAGAAAAMREALGATPGPGRAKDGMRLKQALERAREGLPAETAQAAWERGRAMEPDQAVRYARSLTPVNGSRKA